MGHQIRDKWGQESWELGFLGYPTSDVFCGLRDGGCAQRFQGGAIHSSPASGVQFTRGLIREEWRALGWENGLLGYPVSDEICGLTAGGCYQAFQGGALYWSPATGAHFTRNAIRASWDAFGSERGVLGYPTGNEYCGLRDAWGYSGWENGRWGYPTGAEACEPRHCWQPFQAGVLHLRW